jgi:hypothetical protein
MSHRYHEALKYAGYGLHPIPFHPHSKTPAFTEGGIKPFRTRKPTPRELRDFFADPTRNIGLVTGAAAGGLVILDVDGDQGRQSVKGFPLDDTPTVITARGYQAYLFANESIPTKIRALPGVDILADPWQVLTATSIHPDGPTYHFPKGLALANLPRAPVPRWIFELVHAIDEATAIETTTSCAYAHEGQRPKSGNGHSVKESRYLSSGAPVILDTVPTYKSLNPLEVRGLYGDFAANQCVAASLGLPRLGSKFLCLYHAERRPSMTLYVDKHTGAWKVHDWHERGISVHYGLADIFASRIVGHEVRLEGNPTLTVWWLRALITSGFLAPADVPAKPLPFKVRPAVRTLYDGFILNFQGRWLYEPGKPMPYTRGFAKAWCGMKSNHVVEDGISWLRRHGYMREAGRQHGSQVYLPGEGER